MRTGSRVAFDDVLAGRDPAGVGRALRPSAAGSVAFAASHAWAAARLTLRPHPTCGCFSDTLVFPQLWVSAPARILPRPRSLLSSGLSAGPVVRSSRPFRWLRLCADTGDANPGSPLTSPDPGIPLSAPQPCHPHHIAPFSGFTPPCLAVNWKDLTLPGAPFPRPHP